MGLGRFGEALTQSREALRLAPDSALLDGSTGLVHYCSGSGEPALPYGERAASLDPSYSTARFWHAATHASVGRLDEAMERAVQVRVEMGNTPTWLVGYVHARAGRVKEAAEVLDAMRAHARRHYVPAIEFAYVEVALGDRDGALASLRRAVATSEAAGRSRWRTRGWSG